MSVRKFTATELIGVAPLVMCARPDIKKLNGAKSAKGQIPPKK